MREQLQCMELCPLIEEELTESLWVRIKEIQVKVTLYWVSAIGHPTRKNKGMTTDK